MGLHSGGSVGLGCTAALNHIQAAQTKGAHGSEVPRVCGGIELWPSSGMQLWACSNAELCLARVLHCHASLAPGWCMPQLCLAQTWLHATAGPQLVNDTHPWCWWPANIPHCCPNSDPCTCTPPAPCHCPAAYISGHLAVAEVCSSVGPGFVLLIAHWTTGGLDAAFLRAVCLSPLLYSDFAPQQSYWHIAC